MDQLSDAKDGVDKGREGGEVWDGYGFEPGEDRRGDGYRVGGGFELFLWGQAHVVLRRLVHWSEDHAFTLRATSYQFDPLHAMVMVSSALVTKLPAIFSLLPAVNVRMS